MFEARLNDTLKKYGLVKEWKSIMTTKIIEARKNAIQALKVYMDELRNMDYNQVCIRDSIIVSALDALECYNRV